MPEPLPLTILSHTHTIKAIQYNSYVIAMHEESSTVAAPAPSPLAQRPLIHIDRLISLDNLTLPAWPTVPTELPEPTKYLKIVCITLGFFAGMTIIVNQLK